MNYKLSPEAGYHFDEVAAEAKRAAYIHPIVEFDFNGITCLVDANTNLQYLFRDYCNAFTMDWKTVGPNCVAEYDEATASELQKRQLAIEEEDNKRQEEQDKKDAEERNKVQEKIKDVMLEIIPEKATEYTQYMLNNSKDAYSHCVVEYADFWGRLMQVEIAKGRTVAEVAEETQSELGFFGITGFMYGCAVQALAYFWPHGEELRVWHNKSYGHEGEGVVNPAVMTIGSN